MGEVQLLGNGHCAGRLSLETALLPPPIRGGWWGRPAVIGRPCCRRGACLSWRRGSTASFVTWVSGFLTVAHVIPKRLLVACELTSKLGIPSEPSAELIPSAFRVEEWAILVVWAIFHFRSERISMAVVVSEDSTRNFGGETADSNLCGTWQFGARRSATERQLYLLHGCSLAQNCQAPLLA